MWNRYCRKRHGQAEPAIQRVGTNHVFEPEVFGVVFSAFFATMGQNGLDFVFFLILDIGVDVIAVAVFLGVFELFKVLDVVDIIWDSYASTGHAHFLCG